MFKLKIGIVGCGAIGNSLAKEIVKRFAKEAELAALYDIDMIKAQKLSCLVSKRNSLSVDNLEQLIDRSELVIECASSLACWEIAKKVISRGRNIMIMSAGGVVSRFEQLSALAKKHNLRVYIPSGAICGIDALKAAKIGRIKKVILTTRKNPLSFKGVRFIKDKKIDLLKIRKDRVLFSGKASEAIRYFPQNINVASVLSMAGIGGNNTLVRIIASPSLKRNIHEVRIESKAGRIWTRTENVLHPDNPKTSFLAVLSAIATIEQILNPVKIGT